MDISTRAMILLARPLNEIARCADNPQNFGLLCGNLLSLGMRLRQQTLFALTGAYQTELNSVLNQFGGSLHSKLVHCVVLVRLDCSG